MRTSSYITIAIIAVFIAIGGIFMFVNQTPESENLTAGITLNELNKAISSAQPQVTIYPASIKAGESVTVTVDTTKDVPSFWSMDVYLEGPDTENTIIKSIINIDGEGRRFGDITIPLDAKEGKWRVKTIKIINPAGSTDSYNYEGKASATFIITK